MSKLIDLTGQRFGRLVVIKRASDHIKPSGQKEKMWACQCDCGNQIISSYTNLTSGNTKSCGCYKIHRTKECLTEDLTGQRFGMLTVIEKVENKNGRVTWKCKCDCGGIRISNANNIKSGKVKSCGCMVKNNRIPDYAIHPYKHKMSKTRIYRIWANMRNRCEDKNSQEYSLYGGRGIRVCDEWLGEHGSENFIKWAYENGYDENVPYGECTIDRIDVNGNYEPSNCKWSTAKEQANNRRTNLVYEYNGKKKTLMQWCELYNKKYYLVRQRIRRDGWSFERALFEESRN